MPRIKLVRDRCNAVLEGQCEPAGYKSEYQMALVLKMHEEIEEIAKDPSDPAEYADLLEVLLTFAELHGVAPMEILKAREEKREALGAFEEGQIWTEVTI